MHDEHAGIPLTPTVTIVEEASQQPHAHEMRQRLVGPGHNQPDPFPGYMGFVGWVSPLALRDGTLLVGFSAGYWHASPPTPHAEDEETRSTISHWVELGMPSGVHAPTGGRAMLIRSTDHGATWSKPRTLVDTPDDDRHPNFIELDDGTILCSFFRYPGPGGRARTQITRSVDGGRTWETPQPLRSPMSWDATDGPFVVLDDGAVLLAVYGAMDVGGAEHIGMFRSEDSGRSWDMISVVKTDGEMSEPGIAQLPDGRLVMISRPEGHICWSDDRGESWTKPVSFGMRMYEPGLLALSNGVLMCLAGTYNDKPGVSGIRSIFSRDGGSTWLAPAPDHGSEVDGAVYGYCRGVELPDGSVLITYLDTGGHRTQDAASESLWALRFRVRDDLRGITPIPLGDPPW